MAAKDIEKHQFKKGQSGNPNGRPRKSFSQINLQLKEQGIEPLTKTQLIEAYSLIFNCTEEELKDLATQKETPYSLKLIITELNDKKTRSKALADYRDYMFGKAAQSIDHTSAGDKIQSISINKWIDNNADTDKS